MRVFGGLAHVRAGLSVWKTVSPLWMTVSLMVEPPLDSMKPVCAGRGRPRCGAARSRILEAAYEQLAKRGWESFTIEGVAHSAGCSKATVYRWWPDRQSLAVDAFIERACREDQLPDTGCLYCDLEEQILKVVGFMTGGSANVLRAVLMAIQEQPDLLVELEVRWSPMRRDGLESIVAHAVDRGQLPDGVDVERMFQMVFGPVMMAVMFGKGMEKEEIRPIVSQVLASFGYRAEGAVFAGMNEPGQ